MTLAPLAACGPARVRCTTSNCSGCCDAADQCQTGNTFAACGVNGATCLACPTGNSCEVGVCSSTNTGGGGGATGGGGGATGGGGGGAVGGGGGAVGGGGGAVGGGGGAVGGGGGAVGGGGGGGGGSTGGGGGSTGGGAGGGGGSQTATVLTSGQSITISGVYDGEYYYQIVVPAGTAQLVVTTTGGTGDVDLFIKAGGFPDVYGYDYDDSSETDFNEETITVPNPPAGTYYVDAFGFDDFAGVTLTATW